jgi:rubrerythrin
MGALPFCGRTEEGATSLFALTCRLCGYAWWGYPFGMLPPYQCPACQHQSGHRADAARTDARRVAWNARRDK